MTVVAQVHMCLPYPLPSHRPACGCQESRSLAVPAPHACACLCTLSGPLFIQAPRFTRWYGWSSIKSDDEDNFRKRPRVAATLGSSARARQRPPPSREENRQRGHRRRECLRRPLQRRGLAVLPLSAELYHALERTAPEGNVGRLLWARVRQEYPCAWHHIPGQR